MPTEQPMTKKVVALAALMLAGCDFGHYEYSAQLEELATVEDVIFAPSQHGSGVSPGMTSSGKLTMSITTVDIPEKYAIVFQCPHGKFVIEGSGERYKTLWSRLSKGQRVVVLYREEYLVTEHERSLRKLDFIDALPADPEKAT
jgi:hypothetical protein